MYNIYIFSYLCIYLCIYIYFVLIYVAGEGSSCSETMRLSSEGHRRPHCSDSERVVGIHESPEEPTLEMLYLRILGFGVQGLGLLPF